MWLVMRWVVVACGEVGFIAGWGAGAIRGMRGVGRWMGMDGGDLGRMVARIGDVAWEVCFFCEGGRVPRV